MRILCFLPILLFSLSLRGQNVDLQSILDKSFCNLLNSSVPLFKQRFGISRFRVIGSFIPYGLRMESDSLYHYPVVYPYAKDGDPMAGVGCRYQQIFLGNIFMNGDDTLTVNIVCRNHSRRDKKWFLSCARLTMFSIDGQGNAAEVDLPQREIEWRTFTFGVSVPDPDTTKNPVARERYAVYRNPRVIRMDSVCYRALANCLAMLEAKGVRRKEVYLHDDYFPAFYTSKAKDEQNKGVFPAYFESLGHILTGHDYRKFLKKGNCLVGWPQLFVRRGQISVRMHYITKVAPKIDRGRSVEVVYRYNSRAGYWQYDRTVIDGIDGKQRREYQLYTNKTTKYK